MPEPNEVVIRHLFDAVKRVCEDVEIVGFWAEAVAGFAQPVPDFDPADTVVWLPHEQAMSLKATLNKTDS